MVKYMFGLAFAMLAGIMLTGCGPGSDGTVSGTGGTPDNTGQVSFLIKDAPLSSLQSLTIDITGATLQGIAGTPNFTVFPQTGSPAFMQVDLLALQGVAQLLASANVPNGTYGRLVIDYDNPQATDFAAVPQVITSPTNFMIGQFHPHLVVTTGSLQSVVIDVDLRTAYHDLGGNQGMLTPVAHLSIVGASPPAGPPMPVARFFGMVTALDVPQDSFDADAFMWAPPGPPSMLGPVSVQCNAQTIFHDGQTTTVGGVTALLNLNDVVMIEGIMTGGVIDASAVTRLSLSALPQPPSVPPVQHLAGTIMNVDTVASQITVKVQWAVGIPAAPFTDVIVDVAAATTIRRGPTPLVLGDLTAGNSCHVMFDPMTGDATDIDERPSFICGDVVAVSPGGGVGGTNRVEFTPTTVNQIPVAQMTFVPSPLFVDLPLAAPLPAVSANFCIWAFFDGSSTLELSHHSGGFVGPPPPMPGPGFVLSGRLEPMTTATVNLAGDVEFSLVAFDVATASLKTFDVTVTSTAAMTLFSMGATPLATAQDAANAINAHPEFIQVIGSAAPVALAFTADVALQVYANAGPVGPPVPPPPPGPGTQVLNGYVSGTAVINGAGDIEFTLQLGPGFGPTIPVVVSQTAAINLVQMGTPTALTVAQAVAELNTAPAAMVQVEGTATQSGFNADVRLDIYR